MSDRVAGAPRMETVAAMEALRRAQEELVEKERLATGLAAQMRALVRANLAITTELSLERVLERIAEAGLDVVGARYSALGVIDETGTGLSQFIAAGIDRGQQAAIGSPPTGRGILGLLIRDRRPIRLRDLSRHPQAAGFPPSHPPMTSFLGVPVVVRDRAYGTLYFTEKHGADEFSETDEAAAQMLAAQAGIAIENAQTFQALHEAQEELVRQERLATLGQLAGGISHELRNPLGVIKNSVYYLRMVLPANDKVARHLAILEREVARSNRIVTDLLDFARGKSANRAPTDLGPLIAEALDRLALAPNITVVHRLTPGLPRVTVDAQQIEQALHNLLTNACQAMPEGGTLTVETAVQDGTMVIAVSDTGLGIERGHLGKIFQPLFTTKPRGIGLGLALAKSFIEANGGTLTVDSVPGRGSRFIVGLPLAAA